ncbi:hypothetical protein OH76DRAFT_677417 [Lentinus brumalis]|uniref:GATA-type domain-containing protein n=1 Tax=Lentinus brumalis TaxID=2498619 RepID=A0A371D6H8_9APHY|nr:hypothetical protein OH76DRAFT_677417 [Polyporus brumalis]
MPPYQNASHDHAQSASSSQNPVTNSQRSSVASTTSYTSLGHALAPAASRAPDQHNHRQPTPNNSRPPPQMASEGRYMYHQQEVPHPPPYPYPYPAAPPYENGQYAQASSRAPVRSPPPPQPVSHPPPQQPVSHPPPPGGPYNGAHPSYPPQPGYPPPAYGVPPQQWSGEWSHYNAPYPPTAPPGQSPYPPSAAPGARPDMSPNNPHDDRRYAQPPARQQEPQSRRTEERPPQRPEAAPPPPAPVRKTRENEPPTQAHAPPPPAPVAAQAPAPPPPPPSAPPAVSPSAVGIDFLKLLDSYRLIIDSTNAIAYEATPARPPPPADTLERMLQAATYGAQVLDAAAKRAVAEPPRPPADRSPDEGDDDGNQARQQGESQAPTEGQTCLGCSATSTPEWRRGPMGPRTLCNACGLVYAKLIKKRNRNEPGRGRGGGQPARSTGQIVSGPVDEPGLPGQEEPSDSDSDDDGSYGSQQDRGYRRD